jgi:hypothetical protein
MLCIASKGARIQNILTTEKMWSSFLGKGVYSKSIVVVRVRRSNSSSFETGENVSVSHFASNRKKM